LSVTVDGTLIFTHDDTGGPRPRVYSTTAGGFLNFFTDGGALKNLKIVNEKWISDGTSNIAYVGGGEVAVGKALAFNRVSNVSQIKVDSNVVTEYTGPHDRPLRKYPEVALTANDNSSTSGYVADQTAFSGNADGYAYRLFDHSLSTAYQSGGSQYSSGDSTGSAQTTTATDGSTHQGVAITLDLATKIRLSYAKITSHDFYGRTPVEGTFLGSNNNSTWDVIGTFSGLSTTAAGQTHMVHISDYATKSAYRYIRLVVTKIHTSAVQNGGTLLEFKELEYYGHEEGSGSLDTTLKSVYNVPATTGTQLEVYYDAKDLTTMPSPVPDLSPNTNTGALSTSPPTLDSTDGIESFKFDASSSQRITSSIDTSYWGTNKLHSVAFWFKADTVSGKCNIFHIGNPAASESSAFWISDGSADSNGGNSLNWWFYGGDSTTKVSTFSWSVDTWYHIALTFDGSTKKMYVNGHHIDFSVGNVITTLPTGIPASASLAVGGTTNSLDYFDGSVANFRVYGAKTLNADQVKELYDYQKDYFLGSKSQVTLYKGHLGVGVTEPSGQLELAGDERIQEYPPGPMDDYETLIPGHGVFFASMSNPHTGGNDAWKAFNKATGNTDYAEHAYTPSYQYGANDGNTLNSYANPANIPYKTNGVVGLWIQLELPYEINLKGYSLTARTTDVLQASRMPEQGIIFGSNNGEVWTAIHNHNDTAGRYTSGIGPRYFSVDGTSTYRYFRLVTTKLFQLGSTSGNERPDISELKFFGTPGPTTLDKGSLTLGRSLDVPRISRYDVDTETPRPEKLVVDYDTTVNVTQPVDLSGNGNHGVLRNNAFYSAADKAFDVTVEHSRILISPGDNYPRGRAAGFGTGNIPFTVSIWIQITSGVDGSFFLYSPDGGGVANQSILLVTQSNNTKIAFDFWDNQKSFTLPETLLTNGWYHICGTYDATHEETGRRLFINGIEATSYTMGGGNQNVNPGFQTNCQISLGKRNGSTGYSSTSNYPFYGKLSNFKFYNVALEPSEVKKLYNLGRTGRSMVISDTAVGIGKVPEAQLDVRGVAKIGHLHVVADRLGGYGGHSSSATFGPADTPNVTSDHFPGGYIHLFDNGGIGSEFSGSNMFEHASKTRQSIVFQKYITSPNAAAWGEIIGQICMNYMPYRADTDREYGVGMYTVRGTYSHDDQVDLHFYVTNGGNGTDFNAFRILGTGSSTSVQTTNGVAVNSDDRVKSAETTITNALKSINKLKPQNYAKHPFSKSFSELGKGIKNESGLIVQDVWYDAPEFRHLIRKHTSANPSDTKPVDPVSGDITIDPDYSDWGDEPASIEYIGFIPYLISSIQELSSEKSHRKVCVTEKLFSNINDYYGLIISKNQNISLSSKAKDKSVYGVISETLPYTENNEIFVKSSGEEGRVWVIYNGPNLEAGDYITTSDIEGYGQKQDSENLTNYTVAKITQDCDFHPPSVPVKRVVQSMQDVEYWVYKHKIGISEEMYDTLPDRDRCIEKMEDSDTQEFYYKIERIEFKKEVPGLELEVRQELVNVLDEHGQMQWEDHPTETEKAYKIRYLDANGVITDEANAVHTAAFVGCTYHCG
jgi:hypothetical protein